MKKTNPPKAKYPETKEKTLAQMEAEVNKVRPPTGGTYITTGH